MGKITEITGSYVLCYENISRISYMFRLIDLNINLFKEMNNKNPGLQTQRATISIPPPPQSLRFLPTFTNQNIPAKRVNFATSTTLPLSPLSAQNQHPGTAFSIDQRQQKETLPNTSSAATTRKETPIMTDGFAADQIIAKVLENQVFKKKFAFPGSLSLAKEHARTKFFGIPTSKKCPCCGQLQKERFESIKPNPESILRQQEDKGKIRGLVAVVFFFKFVIYLILMMMVRFLVVDLYNIYSSLKYGSYCALKNCTDVSLLRMITYQFWADTAIYHKSNAPEIIQLVNGLSFLAILVIIIYSTAYRGYLFNKNVRLDEEIVDSTDYSVFITKIPIINIQNNEEYSPKKLLRQMLEQRLNNWLKTLVSKEMPKNLENCYGDIEKIQYIFKKTNSKALKQCVENKDKDQLNQCVESISMCYDTNLLSRLNKVRNDTMVKLQQKSNSTDMSQTELKFTRKIIDRLNSHEVRLSLYYQQGYQNPIFFDVNFLGSAFVTFKYEHFKHYILEEFKRYPHSFRILGQNITIEQASHPEDVRWQNLHLSKQKRDQRAKYGKYIMVCILVVSFIMVGLITIFSHKLRGFLLDLMGSSSFSIEWASYPTTVMSFIITLINTFLSTLSEKMVYWERHINSTNHFKSQLEKVVAAQFLNSALTLFCVPMVFSSQFSDFLGQRGLVFSLLNFIAIDSIKKIVFEYIGLSKIKKSISENLLGQNDKQQSRGTHDFAFQLHLNQQAEDANFDLVDKYAYYINVILLVSFSSYFAPICVPLSAIILTLMYWKDKKALFKTTSFNYELNFNFTRHAISIAQASILIYAIGIIVFSVYFKQERPSLFDIVQFIGFLATQNPFSLPGLVVALIFTIISYNCYEWLDEKIFGSLIKKEKITSQAFNEKQIIKTYQSTNPASRIKESDYR